MEAIKKADGTLDVEATIAAYEKEVARVSGEHATAAAKAKALEDAAQTTAASHTAALAAAEAARKSAEGLVEGARREVAYVRHGIEAPEAREFLEYSYGKAPPEGRPEYQAWLAAQVKAPQPWLTPYLKAPAQVAPPAPGAPPTPPAPPVAASPPVVPGVAPGPAALVAATPEMSAEAIMSLSRSEYEARRAELYNLPQSRPKA